MVVVPSEQPPQVPTAGLVGSSGLESAKLIFDSQRYSAPLSK